MSSRRFALLRPFAAVLFASGLTLAASVRPPSADAQPAPDAMNAIEADVCVYGGTSAGVIAAVKARRLGKRAVLVELGKHLGGMTSGGLGATDTGNRAAIGGMAREFYRSVRDFYVQKYGPDSEQAKDCYDGFRFEPKVAEELMNRLARDAEVPVFREHRLKEVRKEGTRITEIVMENGAVFRARMFIDATYEGDLLAKAKVSYTVGREANAKYKETLNGVQFGHPNHNFKVPVDPFVVEGDPASGFLWGISAETPGEQGEGDHRVQAYNFRMCLTDRPENRMNFPKPAGYDPNRYALLLRYIQAGVWDALELRKLMPNHKTDSNNNGGFSTDYIGGNYAYPEGDYATRERIFQDHVTYQQGLMYFLCNDPRVPQNLRDEVAVWGLCKDEFTETGGWPHQLYIREARRMVSDYVMTEHHCLGNQTVPDPVALAAYTMDSHNVQRVARMENGRWVVRNEGNVEAGGFPPYPISYRSIRPREAECSNLLVPVCLSASHIAYGSIRMEPVFMELGEAAATAACLAINEGSTVQAVNMTWLQSRLIQDGQIITWSGPRNAGPAVAAVDPRDLKGIVVDDAEASKTGNWVLSLVPNARRVGAGYVHDGNAGKGAARIAFSTEIPADETYTILLHFPAGRNCATNVPVTIRLDNGGSIFQRVNQRETDAEGCVSLGSYKLPKGAKTTVTLANGGTDGFVVADAVQFLPMAQ